MKQFILNNKKAFFGLSAALLIGGVTMSFQDSGASFNQQFYDDDLVICDTVPERRDDGHMTMKEFDKVQEDLDKAMLHVSTELKNINFNEIQKTVEASLKAVDMENIMKTVESSLKSIDVEKILTDVTVSLKDLEIEGHSVEIKQALQEAKGEIEKAKIEIDKIDKEGIKKEMENAKMEINKSKMELKGLDMDKIMKEAKEGIDKAKEELKLIKTMFNEMEKDGLVNAKEGFSIEYKEKVLYINGKQQDQHVTDKYRKYIKEDHFKINIDKE